MRPKTRAAVRVGVPSATLGCGGGAAGAVTSVHSFVR